jgi:polyisoprenyl-phosphate glycosyltransferase
VMVRLLLGALAVGAITICGIGWVLFEKLFTTMAIPGWATSAVGILTIILVQTLMLLTIAVFNVMSARSLSAVIPSIDAPKYILARRQVMSWALDEPVQ